MMSRRVSRGCRRRAFDDPAAGYGIVPTGGDGQLVASTHGYKQLAVHPTRSEYAVGDAVADAQDRLGVRMCQLVRHNGVFSYHRIDHVGHAVCVRFAEPPLYRWVDEVDTAPRLEVARQSLAQARRRDREIAITVGQPIGVVTEIKPGQGRARHDDSMIQNRRTRKSVFRWLSAECHSGECHGVERHSGESRRSETAPVTARNAEGRNAEGVVRGEFPDEPAWDLSPSLGVLPARQGISCVGFYD